MFCPDCGLEDKQSNQFCRACGSDLRHVRNALERPDNITASAVSARDEIGRAIAAKIREASSPAELAVVAEDVLPEIEKFLESPAEKRLRRMRIGMILSSIGVGTALGISWVSMLMKDPDVIFLAALAAIDQNLYEASAADGAGRLRRLWHITLPGMRGVIVLLLVLRLGNALSIGFEQFILQRLAVGRDAAEVLDTFAYYYGVVGNNFSYGTAAGLFKGLVSLVLLLAANKVAHMFGEDGFYRR